MEKLEDLAVLVDEGAGDVDDVSEPSEKDEKVSKSSKLDKHESITWDRLVKHGFSPGCLAGSEGIGSHTSACRERLDRPSKMIDLNFHPMFPKVLILGRL